MNPTSPISNRKFEIANFRYTSAAAAALHTIRRAWWYLRQITGDAAYENYVRRSPRGGSGQLMTREEFYLDAVRRRYTGVSRCC